MHVSTAGCLQHDAFVAIDCCMDSGLHRTAGGSAYATRQHMAAWKRLPELLLGSASPTLLLLIALSELTAAELQHRPPLKTQLQAQSVCSAAEELHVSDISSRGMQTFVVTSSND